MSRTISRHIPTYPDISKLNRAETVEHIENAIQRLREESATGLHLGCGNDIIPGLINCDQFSSAADIQLNAVDLSCFADESVDYIENNHMIEHLSFSEVRSALAEWNRALTKGGWLVITCPDLDAVAQLWFAPDTDLTDGVSKEYILKMFYGSQENPGMFHKSGFNRDILAGLLELHGFEVEFSYTPYPERTTPSLLVIARKVRSAECAGSGASRGEMKCENAVFYRDKRFSARVDTYKKLKADIAGYVDKKRQAGAVAVYGMGELCEIIVSALNDGILSAVIDKECGTAGRTFCGLPVISIRDLSAYGIKNIVIASTAHKRDIETRLNRQLADQNIVLIPLDI